MLRTHVDQQHNYKLRVVIASPSSKFVCMFRCVCGIGGAAKKTVRKRRWFFLRAFDNWRGVLG